MLLDRDIDEISNDFLEAWRDYFGQEMYYIRFLQDVTPNYHPVYRESKIKKYDEENKVLFHGVFKENPTEEDLGMGGLKEYPTAMITLVAKELYDQGVTYIDMNDIIEITDRDLVTRRFNIVSKQGKVQLRNRKIFIKLGVREIV